MRNLLIIIVLCCVHIAHAQSNAEEVAIRQVIEAETKAFISHSFAEIAELYWVMDNKTLLNVTGPDGNHLQVDQDDINSRTDVPPPDHASAEKTNFEFIINGDMALATYQQVVSFPGSDFKLYSTELRVLEKIQGAWRIHLSSVHHYNK